MSGTFFFFLFFLLFGIVLGVIGLGLRFLEIQRKKRVGTILQTSSGEVVVPDSNILGDGPKETSLSLLSDPPVFKRLKQNLAQAGLKWTPAGVLLMTAVGAVLGVFIGFRLRVPVFREFAVIAFALLLGSLPYLFVLWKRRKRLSEFEEQFPEALDFLARSMRAGHAFSVSLETMADETPEPLGLEFRQLFNEQNLGAPIDLALKNLADRVPLVDVRFFVSAVLLQRETGGNLAEILTKLGYVIRERFRLKGQVRAVSAHGRITGMILSVMPLVTMLLLTIVAPQYLASMAADSDGKLLILGAIVGQFIGYLWMKKIVNIKV